MPPDPTPPGKKGRILCCKLQCDTVNHTVKSFIHTFLYAGINQKESLVGFKAPDLCCIIDLEPSLRCTPEYPSASYSPGPSGPILPSLCATEIHRWGGCWGGPIHSPGSGPGKFHCLSACQHRLILDLVYVCFWYFVEVFEFHRITSFSILPERF